MQNIQPIYFPDYKICNKYFRKIWENGQFSHSGPLILKLQEKLKKYLGVKHLFIVANGTSALQIAIRALGLNGEIITTPYSFIATSSAIVWQGCRPIFADVKKGTFLIDPKEIAKNITEQTRAILPVHVFGYPCDVEKIGRIAKRAKLKVIYDGAHAFGVKYKGKSIFNYGDISIVSFNETKLFHMAEGGALITNNDKLAKKISELINFGLNSEREFVTVGINAKNSEMHAALGLAVFESLPTIIKSQKEIFTLYKRALGKIKFLKLPSEANNYSYYPIIFPDENYLLKAEQRLKDKGFYVKRYFYPTLNTFEFLNKNHSSEAESMAKRVLCLPLFGVNKNQAKEIVKIIDITTKHLIANHD